MEQFKNTKLLRNLILEKVHEKGIVNSDQTIQTFKKIFKSACKTITDVEINDGLCECYVSQGFSNTCELILASWRCAKWYHINHPELFYCNAKKYDLLVKIVMEYYA